MKKIIIAVLITVTTLVACKKNPITGRRQVRFFPESQMIGMSATAYGDFMTENQANVLPQTDARAAKVTEIGEKMAAAVTNYMNEIGHPELIEGFSWQYNTVEAPTVNAWCMPGGKIVFYTGILELATTEDEIAVIMGHEIAHAVAGHGNERMSQSALMQGATTIAQLALKTDSTPGLGNAILMQSIGIGGQLGMLKFGRKHESESDEMGLIFMNKASYDPYSAVTFWEKMKANSEGKTPPEFMSTHPSNDRRIADIQEKLIEMEAKGEIITPNK
ncbi:MAG: putative Zn-dependent protease [Flavobacteriales bacterium]|jgi:predicted Zn-dependent protease